MNVMEYRVPLIIALVILLIAVIVWKRREKQTNKPKGGKKGAKKTKAGAKKSDDTPDDIDEDDDDDSVESKPAPRKSSDVAEDAKELYDVVHNDLAGGMQIDDFESAAGDLAGDEPAEVFIALKQKYTEAIDANRDPAKSVTVKDYVEILKKSG